jgi:hypothetical protein
MEPANSPGTERQVIAVLRTPEEAQRVARQLVDAGVPESRISVDQERDEAPALRAEMRAELTESVASPQAALIAHKSGNRGFLVTFSIAAAVAIVLSFPLALIDFGLSSYWTRWIATVLVLLALAFVVSLVLGLAWGSPAVDQPAAAHRGTVIRVAADDDRVKQILIDADPIRVDEITAAGEPAGSVFDETAADPDTLRGKVSETVEHMKDESNKPR